MRWMIVFSADCENTGQTRIRVRSKNETHSDYTHSSVLRQAQRDHEMDFITSLPLPHTPSSTVYTHITPSLLAFAILMTLDAVF